MDDDHLGEVLPYFVKKDISVGGRKNNFKQGKNCKKTK